MRHSLRVLACSALLGLASCSQEPSEPSQQNAAQIAIEQRFEDPRDLPALFEARPPALDPDTQKRLERADPMVAGWPSEAVSEWAEAELSLWFRELLASKPNSSSSSESLNQVELANGFCAPEAQHSGQVAFRVCPAQSESNDRAKQLDRSNPEQAQQLLDWLSSDGARYLPGAHGSSLEVTIEILLVEPLVESGAEADCLYRLEGNLRLAQRSPRPAQRDQSFSLHAGGPCSQSEVWQLSQLQLNGFRETWSESPLFVDATAAELSSISTYETGVQLGVDDYFGRMDQRAGTSFQGMQGLAIGDLDGDGLDEALICQQVGVPNQLISRDPASNRAVDRATEMRLDFLNVTRSALFLDLNNDGHQDVVQALAGDILVSINTPKDGVPDLRRSYILDGTTRDQFYNLSAADVDGDGDLDLFGGRYTAEGVMHGMPTPYYDAHNGSPNAFFENDGSGVLSEVTDRVGFGQANDQFTLASVWEDFDQDGDLDLYVVNDFGRNNLFVNESVPGKIQFVERAEEFGLLDIGAGMGASCADVNLDGVTDLYVTNMWSAPGQRIVGMGVQFQGQRPEQQMTWYAKHASGNSLLLGAPMNSAGNSFEDITAKSLTGPGRWAWGGQFTDFDNDGLEDLYVPCGQTTSRNATRDLNGLFWRDVIAMSPAGADPTSLYRAAFSAIHHLVLYEDYSWNGNERNFAYLNRGDGRFLDISVPSGVDAIGDSRCVGLMDWNEDGRVDLMVKNRNAPRVQLFLNQSTPDHNFINFDLVGTDCNRDAIGARVWVEASGNKYSKRLYAGSGYLCQSTKRMHFGLGTAESIEALLVDWPSTGGQVITESFSAPKGLDLSTLINGRWRLVQGQGQAHPVATPTWKSASNATPNANNSADAANVIRPTNRIALADKLPLGALSLPLLDGTAPNVKTLLQGNPELSEPSPRQGLLLLLWTGEHESGERALSALQTLQPHFDKHELAVLPLTVDSGIGLRNARMRAEELQDLPWQFGYLDRSALKALEVMLLDVIGPSTDIPLPLGLFIDSRARLTSMYFGSAFEPILIQDLSAHFKKGAARAHTTNITGGRWTQRPQRNLRRLSKTFRTLGYPELADDYEALHEKRKANEK